MHYVLNVSLTSFQRFKSDIDLVSNPFTDQPDNQDITTGGEQTLAVPKVSQDDIGEKLKVQGIASE